MRFYIDKNDIDTISKEAYIRDLEDIVHISKALRKDIGDEIEVCVPEKAIYNCCIENISKKEIFLKVNFQTDMQGELDFSVDLYQGVVKSAKWDFIIQKNVEFGVNSIIPVQMMRSVSKFGEDKASKKTDRWQKIAISAAKQCYRGTIPLVHEPIGFKQTLEAFADYDLIIIAYENEKNMKLSDIYMEIKPDIRIAIFIGPEGGISDEEIEEIQNLDFYEDKIKIITLGNRILRCESAGMYLMSQLNYIGEINE